MLEDSAQDYLLDQEETLPTTTTAIHNPKKLSIIPLIFLIYFEVSGGAYGEEAAVGAAGPLWAILGFLIFPFIWSIPEALVTAELATAFPGNGGYVMWAHRAFGPFWGSLMGSWKFLSGVINLASYPVLCVDYIKLVFPLLSSGLPRYAAILFSTLFLSFLNYTGLVIVGYTAVCLGVISLIPFLLLALFSIPMIDPSRWISLGNQGVEKNWSLFFNTLFWNLNFWDNASTLAGEVEQPQKTFPKALFSAGLLTCLAYLVPLLAATGATPLNQQAWGKWLKVFLEIGAVLSIIGLYEAQLSSCVYQLLGMAELGFLPQCFSVRSKCLGMLLEFASFLWLRRKLPTMKRPFKVPMKLPGLVVMCLIPSGFLVYIMSVATGTVFSVSCLVTLVTVVWYFVMRFCKSKRPTNVEDEGLEQVG
ncbi:hypothetical protein E1A91_D08G096300v1 [Gossypium mustelinum]|uniref:Amino acid permease/ SLC12A domain-containing protein n=1 Tax=Gossypium mustelinum TaxID=34275 RepID=A0A5D2TTW2_GOSMU|nr:hypothetical protein E1A91_D08G096300v1 [Gossypium mustelinum]